MAEEAAFAVVGKFVEDLVTLTGRQLRYVCCFSNNIEQMKSQVDRLEAKRNAVQLLVDATINNCEVVGPDVSLWLKRVEERKKEVDLVLTDVNAIGTGCLNRWCLNLKSRYWLSRKSTKRTQDLVDLLTQGDFETVAYPPKILGKVFNREQGKIQLVDGKEGDKLSSFEELNSRLAVLDSVMEAVRDVNIHTIGICGMGGVGKTTLVKQVEKMVRNEVLFDEIAIAVVSQNPDVKSIQTGLADFLGLEFTEDSMLARASRLHERLYQKGSNGKSKRILVILDDVWKKLDLEELGIRFPNDHDSCRIVFTSRSTEVCHQMKAVLFHINVLPDEEAWSLFQNSLGNTVAYPVAKAIVAECKGLPIAITTIAMLLGDKEENTWNYVLQQLETSSLQGEYENIYTVFQVSYANLESQERKDVFLLCCLFPEDSNILIEDIVTYGMGLKVFKRVKKIHEARVRTRVHVEALKKLNLLLESEELESFKMHDLVRDFGISIASESKFLVQFDSELKEWPMEDLYERCTHISIECGKVNEFPNGLKYSSLKFFQMSGKSSNMFGFPERLDEALGELQVLVLRDISIPQSLLESFEQLKNLRTLSLISCDISKNLSGIGNIEKLEILSFVGSEISELPIEIGKLRWLRLLDLSRCVYLRKIAPGVIKSLTRLEELKMAGTSILRDEEYRNDEEGDEIKFSDDEDHYACFAELKYLLELVVIEIEMPYVNLLLDLNLVNLMKFRISIDRAMVYYYGLEEAYQNCLVLKGQEFFPLKLVLEVLCKKTEFLLVEVQDLKCLTNEVEEEDLISLRTLIFQKCEELLYVFDGINQGFNSCGSSFRNLTSLELSNCNKLQSVCPVSTARNFINLERLNILDCILIHEIFSMERAENGHRDEEGVVELRKLKEICLSSLPNLTCFCTSVDDKFNLPQLKKVDLTFLPKLTSLNPELCLSDSSFPDGCSSKNPLFHQEVMLNNMVELDIFGMENVIELWHGHLPQLEVAASTFGPRSLRLRQCDNLLRVFSSSTIIQRFECLESLDIHLCDSVEVIYDIRGMINIDNVGNKIVVLSTQLSSLSLSGLPKLASVVRRGPHINFHGFQNLKDLYIYRCESLESIFSLSVARGMPMLETVSVSNCNMIQAIFLETEEEKKDKETVELGHASTIVFPNLQALSLEKLPSLVGFCKSNNEVEFPRLKYITLGYLPNLVGLSSGMETDVSGQIFEKKVKLNWSSLESLTMEKCGFLEGAKTWTNILGENKKYQKQVQYLANLTSLCIWKSKNLMTIFPENVHLELQSIEEIQLTKLSKLESVWQENAPREIQYFQNLQRLFVFHCTCLRTLFTPYVAENLTRLKTLTVDGCVSMEEIVAEQEDGDMISIEKQVLFPNLEWLTLNNLPNLLIVLPERYSFNWSCLENIGVGVDEGLLHLLRRPERA